MMSLFPFFFFVTRHQGIGKVEEGDVEVRKFCLTTREDM